jgi:1-acyl-sn-glycerol-3-phosphate acyltransferase
VTTGPAVPAPTSRRAAPARPCSLPGRPGAPPPRPWVLRTVQLTGGKGLHVLMDVRVHGRGAFPRTGPLLVAGNHSSWLDGPFVVMEAPRPVRMLTKTEMFTDRLARPLHLLGQIPIDRSRPDRTALMLALAELAAGGAVGVFPEGTRGAGDLAAVHHGLGYLAVRSAAPILPVACLGTAAALPSGARWPRWRAPVDIVFGRPFTVTTPGGQRASRTAFAAAAEEIRRRLLDHLSAARSGYART